MLKDFPLLERGRVTRNCINSYNAAWSLLAISHPGNGAAALLDKVAVLPSCAEKSMIKSARSAGPSNTVFSAAGLGRKPPSVPIC